MVGGGDFEKGETEIVDSHALALANPDKPIALVPTAAAGARRTGSGLLEYLEDLGGPGGYVVPLFSASEANDPDARDLLANAGMIVLGSGDRADELARAFDRTAALEGMAQAFAAGAVIYGVVSGARLLGSVVAQSADPEGEVTGLGWVGSAIIEPGFVSLGDAPVARALLERYPEKYCLGIPGRVALALGPRGEVETWGAGRVTVSLGAGWKRE